jgi:hypothetical protein
MADWPVAAGCRIETAGALTASSAGTTITAGAVDVKGSWAQLIASTSFTSSALIINWNSSLGLLDIGIGASGSEVVLIPNIMHANSSATAGLATGMLFPICVPAGARLSARTQSFSASAPSTITVELISGGFSLPTGYNVVNAYGINNGFGATRGTSIDPGATVNTKGAWTQITASTTRSHAGLMMILGTQNNTVMQSASFLYDIGVGASGSEIVLLSNYLVKTNAANSVSPEVSPILPMYLPAASRLAIRCQCSINDSSDRLLDAALYGIR